METCAAHVPLRSLHNQGRRQKQDALMLLSGPADPQVLDPLAGSDLQTLLSSDNGSDSEYLKNAGQIPARQARQDRRRAQQRPVRA